MLCAVLLYFQQSFEILDEDDASFILKVTQTLTDALVEYRHQLASNKVMWLLFQFYSTNLQITMVMHFFYYVQIKEKCSEDYVVSFAH